MKSKARKLIQLLLAVLMVMGLLAVRPMLVYAMQAVEGDYMGVSRMPQELEDLEILSKPDKRIYHPGEALDLSGLIVIAVYADGELDYITGYTTDPAEGTVLDTLGPKTVTVSYSEGGVTKSASFTVAVEDPHNPRGQCGDSVYWSLDIATGELVISGEGDMGWEYDDPYPYFAPPPWGHHVQSIKSVTISEGVTNIILGSFAFHVNMTKVEIASSVRSIGFMAFSGCEKLSIVTIPDVSALTIIGDWAFTYCLSLESITLPASVHTIDSMGFGWCEKLASVFFKGSAPVLEFEFFSPTFEGAAPGFTVYYYEGTSGWPSESPGVWNGYPAVMLTSKKPEISIANTTGRVGTTVTVPIVIANSPEITGLEFRINYNDDAMTLTAGRLPESPELVAILLSPYPSGKLFAFDTGGVDVAVPLGTLLYLDFYLHEGIDEDVYPIWISNFSASNEFGEAVEFAQMSGSISAMIVKFGYFTDREQTDSTDVTWIRRYIVSGRDITQMTATWNPGPLVFKEPAAHFLNRAMVDSTDILWLRRYIVSDRNVCDMLRNFNQGPLDFSHLGPCICDPSCVTAFDANMLRGITALQATTSNDNSLVLLPSSDAVLTGGTFTVDMTLNLSQGELYGLELVLSFDPADPAILSLSTVSFPPSPSALQGLRAGNRLAFDARDVDQGHTGSAVIATLTFEVLDDTVPAAISITIDRAMDEWGQLIIIPDPLPIVINPHSAVCEHIEGESVITSHATCEEEGEMSFYCLKCLELLRTETISELGHDFTVLINHQDATADEDGYDIFKCNRCNETQTVVIPKTGGVEPVQVTRVCVSVR